MNKEDFSFEGAMERLEAIVRMLESGKVSLDESMKLYEEGVILVREANTRLAEAKQRIVGISDGDLGDE